MAQRTGRRSAEELAAQALLLCIVAVLFYALIANGADNSLYSAACALSVCVLSGLLVLPASGILLPLSAMAATLLLAASIVSGLAGNWHVARTESLELATGIILFTVGTMCGQRSRLRRLLQNGLLAASAAYFILVLLLASLTRQGAGELFWDSGRLAGTFASPNSLAAYCAMGGLLALSLILDRVEYLRRREAARIYILQDTMERCFLSMLVLLCATICLLLTGSRAGSVIFLFLATLMTIASLMSGRRRRRRGLAILLPILGVGLVLSAVAVSDMALNARLETLASDTESRVRIYTVLIEAWQQKWLTGHGLGSMEHIIDEATTLSNAPVLVLQDKAHNIWLQWLVQTGVIGTAMATVVVAWMLLPSAQLYLRQTNRHHKALPRAVIFVFAFLILHGQVDYALEIPALMWMLAVLMGVGAGTSRANKLGNEREKNAAIEETS